MAFRYKTPQQPVTGHKIKERTKMSKQSSLSAYPLKTEITNQLGVLNFTTAAVKRWIHSYVSNCELFTPSIYDREVIDGAINYLLIKITKMLQDSNDSMSSAGLSKLALDTVINNIMLDKTRDFLNMVIDAIEEKNRNYAILMNTNRFGYMLNVELPKLIEHMSSDECGDVGIARVIQSCFGTLILDLLNIQGRVRTNPVYIHTNPYPLLTPTDTLRYGSGEFIRAAVYSMKGERSRFAVALVDKLLAEVSRVSNT